jgi:hypothetical protein
MRKIDELRYKVICWPHAQGAWWLVVETGADGSLSPVMELHPTWNSQRDMPPTYPNQLYKAAELLAEKGLDAINNPHAMIGEDCRCNGCFCCAAREVLNKCFFPEKAAAS